MPDRDLFDNCSPSKAWNEAFKVVFRDGDDPNIIPTIVSATEETLCGLGIEFSSLSEWFIQSCRPSDLLSLLQEEPPFPNVPVELKEIFEYAARRTLPELKTLNQKPARDEVLAPFLAFVMRKLVENSQAITIARNDLHMTSSDVRKRLAELEDKLIDSQETKRLAAALLKSITHPAPSLRKRRRKRSDTVVLIDIPLTSGSL